MGCRGSAKGETGANWEGREVAQRSLYSEDGKAGHRGTGLSNRQSGKGNRVNPLSEGMKILHTKLDRVEQRSRQDRGTVFNNLGYLINMEMLQECFDSLDGTKAVGIDGVSKENYGKNLVRNLEQ